MTTSRYGLVSRIGGRGPGPERFKEVLRGIAVDARDRLYALDDSEVKMFAPGGELLQH